MRIELREITVMEVTDGFLDSAEQGVVAFGGKLDIRPPYQREFIYKDKQRDAVIESVRKDFPLNVMYWAVRGDGHYEVIDAVCELAKLPEEKRQSLLVEIPKMSFSEFYELRKGKEEA